MSDLTIVRQASLVDAEVKGRLFRGYAAVFDSPWDDALVEKFGYIERVARGAFRKALTARDNVPFLLGHDRNMVLGTTGSGNVKVSEEPKGLLVAAKLPDNHLGEYARSMVESGDLRGMSFGAKLNQQADVIRSQSNGILTQTIANTRKLIDVSLTWEPSYLDTTVELRSQGFVALSSQENGPGEETQQADSGDEKELLDDGKTAWWVEPSAEADTDQPLVPWWELLARRLEEEN